MSFLSWFGKKQVNPESQPGPSSDLGQADITVPNHRDLNPAVAERALDANSRRTERLERRELLYGAVRECMTAAGVLSSTYKFKVLSLDSSGRKYLLMVDMPPQYMSDMAFFAATEGAIARSAKERFDILVTAVYWRANEQVSVAGKQSAPRALHVAQTPHAQHAPQAVHAAPAHTPSTEAGPPPSPAHAPGAPSPDIPIDQDEVLAFKRAVAAAAAHGAASPRGETRRTIRRSIEQVPDFSNTEPFDTNAPLGPSQFGGLN